MMNDLASKQDEAYKRRELIYIASCIIIFVIYLTQYKISFGAGVRQATSICIFLMALRYFNSSLFKSLICFSISLLLGLKDYTDLVNNSLNLFCLLLGMCIIVIRVMITPNDGQSKYEKIFETKPIKIMPIYSLIICTLIWTVAINSISEAGFANKGLEFTLTMGIAIIEQLMYVVIMLNLKSAFNIIAFTKLATAFLMCVMYFSSSNEAYMVQIVEQFVIMAYIESILIEGENVEEG